MGLNVLRHEWGWRHPIRRLRELPYILRNSYYRIRFGFCPTDVWNLDNWLLEILPPMLRYLRNKGIGFPGNEEFPSEACWRDWLTQLAAAIEDNQEANVEKKNPWRLAWHKELRENGHDIDEELRKLFWEEEEKIAAKRQAALTAIGEDLFSHLLDLWD